VITPLRTPVQRAWFVVAVLGSMLVLAGIAIFAIQARYGEGGLDRLLSLAFDPLTLQISAFEGHLGVRTFQIGLSLAFVGFVLAYLYPYTLGALFAWVRQGGKHP
jgi:hypothetical protein